MLHWDRPFHTVRSGSFENGDIVWFPEGGLNASYNCVDRWAFKHPDKVSLSLSFPCSYPLHSRHRVCSRNMHSESRAYHKFAHGMVSRDRLRMRGTSARGPGSDPRAFTDHLPIASRRQSSTKQTSPTRALRLLTPNSSAKCALSPMSSSPGASRRATPCPFTCP